jgi:hypothetical protein
MIKSTQLVSKGPDDYRRIVPLRDIAAEEDKGAQAVNVLEESCDGGRQGAFTATRHAM